MTAPSSPLVLLILDGFGLSPAVAGNAILNAKTPTLDRLTSQYPYVALRAHGTEVGLPWGEMGNSDVGHVNLGAGRIVLQDVTRITMAIDDGSFATNEALLAACRRVKETGGTLHCLGLASPGGVHGHIDHLLALLSLAHAQGVNNIHVHLIADGRDTEPRALTTYLARLEQGAAKAGAQIRSLAGRYYAMDRDQRWDRTRAAYAAIARAEAPYQAATLSQAVLQAYQRGESDEFIQPTLIGRATQASAVLNAQSDVVIFTNYRSDRARQLAQALGQAEFADFQRPEAPCTLVTMTDYGVELAAGTVAFPEPALANQFAAVVAHAQLRQLHVAETEKYAHATYFFNGGVEPTFPGEKRLLIHSPKVTTYDQAPAMAVPEVMNALLAALASQSCEVAIVNLASPDMVGHTGNLAATTQAIEVVDRELGRLLTVVETGQARLLLTADHGNAEQLIHPETGDIDKEHTTNPVPLLYADPHHQRERVPLAEAKLTFMAEQPIGILADVAPTALELLGLTPPTEMTGQSLLSELERS
ncbi:2,3-bisphosphoglycerate-independent phosphoglycerate mutase [Candidatus Berkelbacteria bacterium]|nr:2,3-bisphosphoglycerate-independent phosphoglycerate mutase [Candidatus Berkelbacteria bacterium]